MRVVIGEDESLLREGLTMMLTQGKFEVVSAVADATELLRETRRHVPDLVITDIRMPPEHTDDGLRAALLIRKEFPQIGLVVLSQHLQRRYALELLNETTSSAGVGYLLKQRIADVDTFRRDIERVGAGGTVLDPEVVELMVSRARGRHGAVDRLTDRQREVLELMAQGRSNAAIARSLSVSEKAVVRHVSNIYDVLDLTVAEDDHRRVLAVMHYLSSQ
jgi:DNA-binding NarL/FixJ family response regulator